MMGEAVNTLSQNLPAAPCGTRNLLSGPDPDVLAGIYEPEVNLAVWQRGERAGVSAHCQDLLRERHPLTLRRTVTVDTLRREPETALPASVACGPLGTDIALIVDMFACLFELDQVGIRLLTLDGAMCPRFHVDRVYCRLLTTYGGPGTQWLRTRELSRPWRDLLADAERGDPAAQKELDTWTISIACQDVALLKGESWPDNEGHGLAHRSPQVAPDSKRLLLTLDIV